MLLLFVFEDFDDDGSEQCINHCQLRDNGRELQTQHMDMKHTHIRAQTYSEVRRVPALAIHFMGIVNEVN